VVRLVAFLVAAGVWVRRADVATATGLGQRNR
jgi:hypothetical protein